jgi:hypothetical protein
MKNYRIDTAFQFIQEMCDFIKEKASRSEWFKKDGEKYCNISQKVLEILEGSDPIPQEMNVTFYLSIETGKADEAEEWWERSNHWEIKVISGEIVYKSYSNLATIVGASQTDNLLLHSSAEEKPEDREALSKWLAGAKKALSNHETYVRVYEKK